MKLIIDISDKDYKFIKEILCLNFGRIQYKTIQQHIINAIKNGIPYEERPQGEWITHQTGMLLWEECNQCHAQVGTVGMNFCPNCGSDMRTKGGTK